MKTVITYSGRVTGNNIRYKFPKLMNEPMTEHMRSSIEIETGDDDVSFSTFSNVEIIGTYKIGSPVKIHLEIEEQ